jgi:crotonobetainyl-CoA:carnitine CoA-transferase CaiB-like acyl-CoA transferase
VHLSSTPATVRRRAPDLGEHSAEIRTWLERE